MGSYRKNIRSTIPNSRKEGRESRKAVAPVHICGLVRRRQAGRRSDPAI